MEAGLDERKEGTAATPSEVFFSCWRRSVDWRKKQKKGRVSMREGEKECKRKR